MGLLDWLMKQCGCANDPEPGNKKPVAVKPSHLPSNASADPSTALPGTSSPNRQIKVAEAHTSRGGLLSRDNSGEKNIKVPMLHMVEYWPDKSTYKDNIGNYFYILKLKTKAQDKKTDIDVDVKMLVRIHDDRINFPVPIKNLDGFIAAANKVQEFKIGGQPIALSYETYAQIITANQEPDIDEIAKPSAPLSVDTKTDAPNIYIPSPTTETKATLSRTDTTAITPNSNSAAPPPRYSTTISPPPSHRVKGGANDGSGSCPASVRSSPSHVAIPTNHHPTLGAAYSLPPVMAPRTPRTPSTFQLGPPAAPTPKHRKLHPPADSFSDALTRNTL